MKSIKQKIAFPVYFMAGAFILFMALQVAIVFTNLGNVRDMKDRYFATTTKTDALKLSVVQVQQWLTDIGATRAADGFDDGFSEAQIYADKARGLIGELKTLNPNKSEELDQILQSFEPYYETGKRMAEAYVAGGPDSGNAMMEEFDGVAEEINSRVDTFSVEANRLIEQAIAEIEDSIRKAIFLGVAAVVASLTICIVIRFLIGKNVVNPILDIKTAAQKLAKGDLGAQITYQSDDEMGALAENMRSTVSTLQAYISDIGSCMHKMSEGDLTVTPTADFQGDFIELRDSIICFNTALNNLLMQINRSANQVSDSAGLVSIGSQSLAHGAEEQAASVEELTKSIETVSGAVRANAQTAGAANQTASRVGEEAQESNGHMRALTEAMDEINKSSGAIRKIIKTIEDIAFQTNILALNASIEAARAGVAGKGFAVVADEVRNLASKSAEAANSTTKLIEQSVRAVDNGSAIAQKTAQTLNEVVEGIKEVAVTIRHISEASNEQAQAIVEVSQGVSRISEVVQTVSATAQESGAASEELSAEALALKEQVGQFQLSNC